MKTLVAGLMLFVLFMPAILSGVALAQGYPPPPPPAEPGPQGPAGPRGSPSPFMGTDPAAVVVIGALLLLVIVLAIVAVSRGGERPATS